MTNLAEDYASEADKTEAAAWNSDGYAARLRNLLRTNMEQTRAEQPRIHVVQRHVTQSGMSRDLSLFIMVNNEPQDVTYIVADLLGYHLNRLNNTIRVRGVGMDMHFHTVYQIGRELYPNGNPAAERDQSGYTSADAGYMIRHSTM